MKLLIDELLFIFIIVENVELFLQINNFTFVGYVGTSESIISSDHHTGYSCSFELINGIFSFRFQSVFKHLKTIKN